VVEEHDGLLFYPSRTKARRSRPTSSIPARRRSKQAIPAVDYLRQLGKKRFFLLGTDTVYPRPTNAILKSYLDAHGIAGDAVAEFYTPFNHRNWEGIVGWIHRFGEGGDAAIVTTVSGDANIYFLWRAGPPGHHGGEYAGHDAVHRRRRAARDCRPEMAGHLAAWSYLHAIDAPENHAFIAAWRKFCGAPNVVTDDPMEATWIGFNLWKEAVTRAGTVEADAVRRALACLRLKAPSGFTVFMDPANHHLHKPAVIGRITPDARIVPVWMSDRLIASSRGARGQ
jgi:urea transport system substrate-binding protein